MTKVAFAAKVGADPSTVARWEDEGDPQVPGFDRAVLMAQALNISLEELAFGEEPFFERVVEEAMRRWEQRHSSGHE